MRLMIPVTPDGRVESRFGRAPRVAVAVCEAGAITAWDEFDVEWDRLHDEGAEGAHHARIVRFLQEHEVQGVVVLGIGEPMRHTLGKLGVAVLPAKSDDARASAQLAAEGGS